MTRSDYDVNHLIGLLKEFKNRYPHLEIILEPGSAVGWQTGFLISTILDIIDYGELKTLVVDTSFSAHLPDCLEVPYKPVIRGATILENQEEQKSLQTYRIGGLTCLAGDWCGDYIFEKTPQSGDRIIFEDMIHYTMVKTTTFNGVNLPSIGIIRENGNFELVKKFGYADTTYLQTRLNRHFIAVAGKAFLINDNLVLKPSTMVRYTEGAPVNLDLNLNILLNRMFWVGASYRTSNDIILIAEFNITHYLRAGYSYDLTLGKVQKYNSGSHEIFIGFDFDISKTKIISPRFL